VGTLQGFVEQFTYVGVFVVLLLASLGVPIPEEMPVIAAAVLAHAGLVRWWLALVVCFAGVLSGDIVLYWVGHHWGERVLNWGPVRLVLTPDREERLKGAYRKHAVKTIVTSRHVMGFRAAAFLTAGIAHVPFGLFLVVDAAAAAAGVPVLFGLAYFFTDKLEEVLADVRRVEGWLAMIAIAAVALTLMLTSWRRSRRGLADRP
jgi:membrane protein DedA with SNARE-associated domain